MLKLNLGCGNDILNDYENVDLLSNNENNIIVYDVEKLKELYKEESVDEISVIDVLEYVSHLKCYKVLNDWVSLLKVGGK